MSRALGAALCSPLPTLMAELEPTILPSSSHAQPCHPALPWTTKGGVILTVSSFFCFSLIPGGFSSGAPLVLGTAAPLGAELSSESSSSCFRQKPGTCNWVFPAVIGFFLLFRWICQAAAPRITPCFGFCHLDKIATIGAPWHLQLCQRAGIFFWHFLTCPEVLGRLQL